MYAGSASQMVPIFAGRYAIFVRWDSGQGGYARPYARPYAEGIRNVRTPLSIWRYYRGGKERNRNKQRIVSVASSPTVE